jgi:TRAP-type C4-dicarboxylate transport system permease small subunit
MLKLERWLHGGVKGISYVASISVMIMMLLTSADVLLRLFGHPIPGTYELIGFLGAILISFSMAYTSIEKSHIAVEIFVERLPRRVQYALEGIVSLISCVLFGIITWQCQIYALDLKQSGEISMTLGIPVYPFVAGIAIGCGLLCIVLLFDFIKSARRVFK